MFSSYSPHPIQRSHLPTLALYFHVFNLSFIPKNLSEIFSPPINLLVHALIQLLLNRKVDVYSYCINRVSVMLRNVLALYSYRNTSLFVLYLLNTILWFRIVFVLHQYCSCSTSLLLPCSRNAYSPIRGFASSRIRIFAYAPIRIFAYSLNRRLID